MSPALSLFLVCLVCGALADRPVVMEQLNGTECLMKAAGVYPPWNLDPAPPYPPMCQSSYLECDGKSPAGELVEDGLGELEAPGSGSGTVPAVFNWVTGAAALPGAIGTRGCDCEGAYGNGTEGAVACRACEALQLAVVCDARRAVNDASYACLAPFPGRADLHINCTVQGPSVQEGALAEVDPAAQDVIDLEFGLKAPTQRFGILVQQDLADPMQDILATAGLDQDQFVRLLRQPGQAWGAWDVWASQQHPDGAFPSQQELDQFDGIVITGDSGSPSPAADQRLQAIVRDFAGKGKRVLGICGGQGVITRAYGGLYPSTYNLGSLDPYTDSIPMGTANVTVNTANLASVNASWARLVPDSFLINHMPTHYVASLPAGATSLGYSTWPGPPSHFEDLYVIGPQHNVLAFKGHPEATDGATGRSVATAFMGHAADKIALGVQVGKLPPMANEWMGQQVGRQLASYRQYSDAQLQASYEQLGTFLRAFMTEGAAAGS